MRIQTVDTTIPTVEPVRAIEFSPRALAEAMNVCFEDYVHPFTLTPEVFDRRFRRESIDSEASLVWTEGDRPAAIVLVSRRGWTSRIAAMAVAKPYRRQGLGRLSMTRAVEDARARSDRRLILEVIEQNPPAIALYRSVGLRVVRRLLGYERPAREGRREPLARIDALDVTRRLAVEGNADLPWQLAPETISGMASPTCGYCLEGACYALATETPERVVLWTLFTARPARGRGLGSRMVEAIAGATGGKPMVTSVDVPDDWHPAFMARAGFRPMAVSQLEMAMDLAGTSDEAGNVRP